MDNTSYVEIITGLLSIIIELGILGFSIYYVVKKKSIDGVLILVSSIMSILNSPINLLVFDNLVSNSVQFENFMDIMRVYNLISYSLFGIGLVMLIRKIVKA